MAFEDLRKFPRFFNPALLSQNHGLHSPFNNCRSRHERSHTFQCFSYEAHYMCDRSDDRKRCLLPSVFLSMNVDFILTCHLFKHCSRRSSFSKPICLMAVNVVRKRTLPSVCLSTTPSVSLSTEEKVEELMDPSLLSTPPNCNSMLTEGMAYVLSAKLRPNFFF